MNGNPIPDRWRETTFVALTGFALVAVHWHLWGRFLPTPTGRMGHDYTYYLPLLLNGLYWFQANGPFAIPWFTPAFCGGLPMYPNPESIYYSLPQLLTLFVDPVTAIQGTFILFAIIGFVGAYLLSRRSFALAPPASLFVAAVWLFNGAYGARMVIGHMPWHSMALTPLIAYFLLRPAPIDGGRMHWLVGAVVAGFLTSYMFQSGDIHGIVPMAIAVLVIGLVHALRGGRAIRFISGFIAAVSIAGITSAAKLTSAIAFLASSPREGYPLPGFTSLTDLSAIALGSLFVAPMHELAQKAVVNSKWILDRHEFEFSVTFAPLLAIAASAAVILWSWRCKVPAVNRPHLVILAAILLLLAVPVAVNLYTPEWNAVLKRIPIIKNSSNLTRWFLAYVPAVALAAGLAIEHLSRGNRRVAAGAAATGIALVVMINLGTDFNYYRALQYDPRTVVAAHRQAKETGNAPPISLISVPFDHRGMIAMPVGRNDGITEGKSQLLCYAAIFGYRLEWLPWRNLRPGPTFERHDGWLNLFDPACFVYPESNACRPGDRFPVGRSKDALAFATYRPYSFQVPGVHKAAEALNLIGVVAAFGFLAFAAAWSRIH
jgi:hypothetical protein